MAYTKYSLTPANNTAAPPDGAPEGMLPSAVNDTMRDMMAQIRDCGDGIRGGTYTMTAPVITGGSITGVALSGNTLTNPVITGGSINNTPIGASTANTGAFTTLAASGTTTLSGNQIISVTDNSNAALRITQLGTGNALLVEDSTNPDSTPFVIDNSGRTISGYTSSVSGTASLASIDQIHGTTLNTSSSSQFMWSDDTSGTTIAFNKSRGTSPDTQTSVNANDTIGTLLYGASDGTSFVRAAQIVAAVDGTPGTSDMPGRLVFSTTADGGSTPTERMRIDSTGAVGIGSTSLTGYTLRLGKNLTGAVTSTSLLAGGTIQPDVTTSALYLASSPSTASNGGTPYTISNLHHHYASQGTFNADSTVTNQFGFSAQSSITGATNNYAFYSNIASGTGRWNFYANGTADNYFAGNVGIGTSAPAQLLEVAASNNGLTSTTANNTIRLTDTDTTSATNQPIGKIEFYSSDANAPAGVKAYVLATSNGVQPGSSLSFATANTAADATEAMRIDSSGNVGIGTSSPSGDGTFLHINASSFAHLHFTNSSTGTTVSDGSDIITVGTDLLIRNRESAALQFATSGTERMRIDSSGNVGIGISAPTYRLHLDNINAGDGIAIQDSNDSNSVGLYFLNGSDVIVGSIFGLTNNTGMSFQTNGSERMRIDASGNVLIGKTSATANGGDLQVSSGITFPATQVAKSDANTLDDYEEGTWTITVTTGTSGTVTASAKTGAYTKVGRLVTITGYIDFSSVSSPVGYLRLSLPFTSGSGVSFESAASFMFNSIVSANVADFIGTVNNNSATLDIYLGNGSIVSATSANQVQASTSIRFQASYMTA